MNHNDLTKLYTWLWPFRPDDRDYMEALDDPQENFKDVIIEVAAARPDLFWTMLRTAHEEGTEQANDVLITFAEQFNFTNPESVSQLAGGIQLPGYASGYSRLARDKDNNELSLIDCEPAIVRDQNLSLLFELWNFLIPSPHEEITTDNLKKLLDLAISLIDIDIPRDRWIKQELLDASTERQALGWMLAWAISETGNEILDYTDDEVCDNGIVYGWTAQDLNFAIKETEEADAITDLITTGFNVYAAHKAAIHANIEQILKGAECNACTWPF